jgi:hypothetical protein
MKDKNGQTPREMFKGSNSALEEFVESARDLVPSLHPRLNERFEEIAVMHERYMAEQNGGAMADNDDDEPVAPGKKGKKATKAQDTTTEPSEDSEEVERKAAEEKKKQQERLRRLEKLKQKSVNHDDEL